MQLLSSEYSHNYVDKRTSNLYSVSTSATKFKKKGGGGEKSLFSLNVLSGTVKERHYNHSQRHIHKHKKMIVHSYEHDYVDRKCVYDYVRYSH